MIRDSNRNPLPLPPIQHEDLLKTPLRWPGCHPGWEDTVCTPCRLNMHHTLASIRWNHRLRGPLKPQHSLDLALSAIYRHGPEVFPDNTDVIRQPETVGLPSWRLLKNKRYRPGVVPINMPKWMKGPFAPTRETSTRPQPNKGPATPSRDRTPWPQPDKGPAMKRSVDPSHPLRLGGLGERRSPFGVKLGISSHHSPQSNNGFSRNSYGAFYTS